MKEHNLTRRPWMLLLGAVMLIGAHVIFFSQLRHRGASLAVVSGLALLMVVKHFGVLTVLYTLFYRVFRR